MSVIYVYNTLTRKKEEFIPLKKGRIGMYVCGPTVYDEPHIGHARSAYVFDVIRRYLVYKGYSVKFVRNVTDVDDKIIEKARVVSRQPPVASLNDLVKEISSKYLDAYHSAMEALQIGRPDKEPKATEYISKMVKSIELLIKNGCAYEAGADVYFDIKKAKDYGKLSCQSIDKITVGARVTPGENKKDPLDFALWKKAKEGEPSWPSPWGQGRPGWHIECSAMSSDILGDEFDIHCGGIDLIFPHHENEIAQSEGAGKRFARYWLHNGLLTINGQKMAKSLGNFITIEDFIKRYKNPDYLKLLFLSAHYSSPVDYSEEKIEEAKRAYERFRILFQKLDRKSGALCFKKLPDIGMGVIDGFKGRFESAMNDDFNTPLAMAVLFDMVNECNRRLDSSQEDGAEVYLGRAIAEFGNIFGLFCKELIKGRKDSVSQDVNELVKRREQLRKEKKYKEADEVRRILDEKGIILEDTKEGTIWRRRA